MGGPVRAEVHGPRFTGQQIEGSIVGMSWGVAFKRDEVCGL